PGATDERAAPPLVMALPPDQPELRVTTLAPATPTPCRVEADVKRHWLAELYCLPPPSGECDALAQSIAKDGKIYEPVILYEGLALDGWIRIQVAKERGIECWAIHFEETKEGIAAQGNKDAL